MGLLEAHLFGKPGFILDGQEIGLPTKKALALLAFVALEGESPRSRLSSLLWGGLPEEDARRNLRQELYRLSKTALGAHLSQGEAVRLNDFESDVTRFRRALEVMRYREALEHWHGTFLDGLEVRDALEFDEWLDAARERLMTERHWALEGLTAELERAGELRAALNARLELLRHNELQESHHREAMRLHALLGEREAALERFYRCKKVLNDELGLEPLPATVELAEQIRAASVPTISAPIPEATVGSPRLQPPLVGRERAWTQMEAAWDAGQMIVVTGEPGVGKTRLIETFARSKGAFLKTEGRPEDVGVPYATLTRSIRAIFRLYPNLDTPDWVIQECSRLVPELRPLDAPPLLESHKLRLFDAWHDLLIGLSRSQHLSCFISDDAQFFDTASFEMGVHGFRRFFGQTGHGLEMPRVIAGFRAGELRAETNQIVDDLVRSGRVALIELEPLSETDVLTAIRAMSGGSGGMLFSRRLHRATNGNPMFILETVRSLFEQGELHTDETGWSTPYDLETQDYLELPIPASVREVVTSRVERLGAAPQRALEAASVLGSDFGLELLIEATALSEWELVEALERAQDANVIQPTPQGHRFTHDLIQRSLEDGLSVERRKLIHRKLASALESTEGEPARIADHLERGGKPKEAVAYRVRAAEAAARAYANEAALRQYAKALEDGVDAHTAFSIHAARAALYKAVDNRTGWGEAANAMAELAAKLHAADLESEAEIEHAELDFRSGRYAIALERAERVLAAPATDSESRALLVMGNALRQLGQGHEAELRLLEAIKRPLRGTTSHQGQLRAVLTDITVERGDPETAHLHSDHAQALFRRDQDRLGQLRVLFLNGKIAELEGEPSVAREHLSEALKLARELGDVYFQRETLVALAGQYLLAEDSGLALPLLQEGLALAREPQDPRVKGLLLYYLGGAHRLEGNLSDALRVSTEAVSLADEVGAPANPVWFRLRLAEVYLDLGNMVAVDSLLRQVSKTVERNGLASAVLPLKTMQARSLLEMGQAHAACSILEQTLADDRLAAREEREAALCLLGEARVACSNFDRALEAVTGVGVSPSVRSRRLAVRLRVGLIRNQLFPDDLTVAEELLQSRTLPTLEQLSLSQALTAALRATRQTVKAKLVSNEARDLLDHIADKLEAKLRPAFLRRWSEVLAS